MVLLEVETGGPHGCEKRENTCMMDGMCVLMDWIDGWMGYVCMYVCMGGGV